MPIAADSQVRAAASRIYRPRWALSLAVPIEAAQPAGTGGGELVNFVIPVSRFSLIRNDHNECDELTVTADWHYAGTDPRLIQSAIGTLHLEDAAPGQPWVPSRANVQFVGVMKRGKRIGSEKGVEVEFLFHDYTALFLACKHYPSKLMPEFKETLSQAWARICANTGLQDPQNPGTILPTAKELGGLSKVGGGPGLVFDGDAQDVVIGKAAPPRIRDFGKITAATGSTQPSVWSIWQQCVGMCGLISFIRNDQCIVTTATNYYSSLDPARFVWGDNIKSFSEERDASVTGKGILITSFNSRTMTTIEGLWPPLGDPTLRRAKVSKKKAGDENAVIDAEDREAYACPFEGTQESVTAYAKRAYEEYSRQEYQGKLTTHEMRVLGAASGTDIDLLNLYDGDSIRVEIARDDLEALGQLKSDGEKIAHLVAYRGYDENVAKLVVKNLNGVLALPPVFLTKRVQIEGETTPEGGSFSVEIQFCNYINLDGAAVAAPPPPAPPGHVLLREHTIAGKLGGAKKKKLA